MKALLVAVAAAALLTGCGRAGRPQAPAGSVERFYPPWTAAGPARADAETVFVDPSVAAARLLGPRAIRRDDRNMPLGSDEDDAGIHEETGWTSSIQRGQP